ncbi:hypothetical protein QWY77_07620 [Thalassotalea ponticola]|uniref:hypothetical protein n=1 Tax=Thalassotalea ponticola TaxID=1523392 RepID=UPI0025B4DD42|nr:hypothetical protein [Thalassotalea ponticola]MDN3652629.1 hypothetical protein [Thalassotalea ponticola]
MTDRNANNNSITNNNSNADITESAAKTRRDFMKKFGKLAAVTPVALTTLMSPETSAAPKSCKPNIDNKHCPNGSAGATKPKAGF